MADITIRIAEEKDLEAVAAIEALSFIKPWTIETVRADFENRTERIYIAEKDGTVCGYSIIMVLPGIEAELNRIAVNPSLRRQGIAQALMNNMTKVCKDSSCEKILLEVRASNSPAISLYKSFGFKTDGIRPKYYDNTEDAVLMSMDIIGQ